MIQISAPSLGDEEWEAVRGPMMSGWLTQGPAVAEFERKFAERHAVRSALATTNCTTALHVMLVAGGVGPGDEVIVPSFTWVSTANAVLNTPAPSTPLTLSSLQAVWMPYAKRLSITAVAKCMTKQRFKPAGMQIG